MTPLINMASPDFTDFPDFEKCQEPTNSWSKPLQWLAILFSIRDLCFLRAQVHIHEYLTALSDWPFRRVFWQESCGLESNPPDIFSFDNNLLCRGKGVVLVRRRGVVVQGRNRDGNGLLHARDVSSAC
jgi:hypothetical protein